MNWHWEMLRILLNIDLIGMLQSSSLRETFKTIGYVPSKESKATWQEFREIGRDFMHKKNIFYKNQKKEYNQNIEAKKNLEITSMPEGIMSLKNMPNKGRFIGHTLFIWLMYLAMFYVVKWTVPETASLGMNAILPAFVVGGLAISATNGGIGIYPFSVALVLAAFKISNESGLAFGWIMWTSQTLMIIVFGSLSFFVLPLVNRQQKD